jgi:hypothetical protein
VSDLLTDLRSLGLAMGSWYAPCEEAVRDDEGNTTDETITTQRFIGWTTDQTKAMAAQDLGAMLRPYTSSDQRFNGWDVSARIVVES